MPVTFISVVILPRLFLVTPTSNPILPHLILFKGVHLSLVVMYAASVIKPFSSFSKASVLKFLLIHGAHWTKETMFWSSIRSSLFSPVFLLSSSSAFVCPPFCLFREQCLCYFSLAEHPQFTDFHLINFFLIKMSWLVCNFPVVDIAHCFTRCTFVRDILLGDILILLPNCHVSSVLPAPACWHRHISSVLGDG